MNLLAIDASTEACSVALNFNGKQYSRFELCPQSHSLVLLPMVDEVLKEASCELSQLDGLVFGQGPGSFTGVRIGIGVAQGLAFAADLQVVGVSTLQAMAQQAFRVHQQVNVVAAIDARMSEIYTGHYQANEDGIMVSSSKDMVLAPELAAEKLFAESTGNVSSANCYGVGTGWGAYKETLSIEKLNADTPDILFPNAIDMLTIAQPQFEQGKAVSAEHAQPVYVRDTVSWKKLPGRE